MLNARFFGLGRRLALACACFVVSAPACQRTTPVPSAPFALPQARGVVFAQVGDAAVTDAQLMAYEGLVAAADSNLSFAALMAKVEDRVRFELLAQAAAERGLAADPEVVESARKTMVRKLLADDMGPARLGADLPEEALRAYYERHQADYMQPEMRRFVVLHFGNDALARAQAEAFGKLWHTEADDARALAAALRAGAAAATADARHRKHAVRAKNQLHWQEEPFALQETISRTYGEDVAAAVFSGEPGTAANAIVQSQRGPVAVRVLACRKAGARSFEQARADIVEQLVRRRRTQYFQAYLEQIRATYPIAIYEDRVRAWLAHPPVSPTAAAAAPSPLPSTVPATPDAAATGLASSPNQAPALPAAQGTPP